MLATGNDIIAIFEELAPLKWALSGDNCGLQWGNPDLPVQSVLLALDFTEPVLEQALAQGVDFIFTHHPYLYKPLTGLDLRGRRAALLARALKEGVTLYSAHTNLDVAPRGVSHALGELLGLEKMEILHNTGQEQLEKLVVFVPHGYEDKVRHALAEAGAGWIGNYSHCTFQLSGTGTFLPQEGSNPFIGTQGLVEKVEEYRLETIMPVVVRDQVLRAMIDAHPYEEVAYDLYPLTLQGEARGLGRVGELPEPVTLQQLALQCREVLQPSSLRMFGHSEMAVQRVAVLGGSGASYLGDAAQAGAQVFICGDICYHDEQQAWDLGLALLDAGHAATERPVLPVVAAFLKEKLQHRGLKADVFLEREG